MVAAIGLTTPRLNTAVSPTAALEAQIMRYQKQLSECVNCDSANTQQGRQIIQQISNKINAAKARIDEINVTTTVKQSNDANDRANVATFKDAAISRADTAVGRITSINEAVNGGVQRDLLKRSGDALGSQIDILA